MTSFAKLEEKIEEILRNQFVDRAYDYDGSTSWGIFETKDELLSLFHSELDLIVKQIEGMKIAWIKSTIPDANPMEVIRIKSVVNSKLDDVIKLLTQLGRKE